MHHRKLSILTLFVLSLTGLQAQDTMSVQQAVETGLANNYGIRLVRNDVEIAGNNNTIGNAGFLPSLSADGTLSNSVNSTRQEFYTGDVREAENANSSNIGAGVQLDWVVFNGFSAFINKDRFSELVKFNEAELQREVENTILQISNTYYEIAKQEQLLDVLESVVEVSARRKFIAETKSNIGAGSKLSELQSAADFNADTALLLQQRALIGTLKAELNELLARDPATAFEVSRQIPLQQSLDKATLMIIAQEQSPAINAARVNMDIAQLNIRSIQAQRYPRLIVFGGYNFNQSMSEVGLLQRNRSIGPAYGVTASIPIFNGFNINRQVENERIRQNSAELAYQSTVLDIKTSIESAYTDYQAQLDLLRLEQANMEVAEKTAFAARERFNVGDLSDIEYRQAQLSLRDAEIRLYNAIYNAKQNEIRLLFLSGQLGGAR